MCLIYEASKKERRCGILTIEEIFCAYRNDVYRLALSYTKSAQEAEDVCQTAFLKLMEQENITPGKERAWLMQVTANECRNLLRSSWWKKTSNLEETLTIPAPQCREVFQAVMGLPPKYRVVIYLHYFEEYTTKEIAQLLHISQTAVTTRLNRARQMLKKELTEVSV